MPTGTITGTEIADFRKKHGLTQVEFLEELGYSAKSAPWLSRQEKGHKAVAESLVERIMDVFNVTRKFNKRRARTPQTA